MSLAPTSVLPSTPLSAQEVGSATAKGGTKFEHDFAAECRHGWSSPLGAAILAALNAPPQDSAWSISTSKPVQVSSKGFNRKIDTQLIVTHEGAPVVTWAVSCKRFAAGFNQVHKQTCKDLAAFFHWSPSMLKALQACTGEESCLEAYPETIGAAKRLTLSSLPAEARAEIVDWFSAHKREFIAAAIGGVAPCLATHLAAYYPAKNRVCIYSMSQVIDHLAEGPVEVSRRGTVLNIGGLTLQRKGGTPDPTKLQVKLSAKKLVPVPLLLEAPLVPSSLKNLKEAL